HEKASKWGAFIVATLYASFLTSLPLSGFKDRISYLRYARTSFETLQKYLDQGITSTLTNEPIWLLLNSILSLQFPPESTVRIIIFLSSFGFSYIFLR